MTPANSAAICIPTEVLKLLEPLAKQSEGCRLEAYQDPNGNWTQGWGHKLGKELELPIPACTQEQADNWLAQDLGLAYSELVHAVPGIDSEPAGRQAALTDFVYNLGIGSFDKSTLHSAVVVRAWQSVKAQLALWVHAGGKVEPGLVRRRAAEIALIDT
jgi:lysozyme